MKRVAEFIPEFVEFIPSDLKDGVIHISMIYGTAAHKCACGCGRKVVTPFSPTDWKLLFDGETVSLHPSIGNWSFKCRSHYWIRQNRVQWAPQWSQQEINAGRANDRDAKDKYFSATQIDPAGVTPGKSKTMDGPSENRRGVWETLKIWWSHH